MISPNTVQDTSQRRESDPTPEQIKAHCRAIRKGWSENTRRRRAGEHREPWTVQSVILHVITQQ